MTRSTSRRVAESRGCRPLFEMYEWARAAKPSTWPQVQDQFLTAMWSFDQGFAVGEADQGDNQNGKGDFFTDLTALLLENCSGKNLHGRGAVPGLIDAANQMMDGVGLVAYEPAPCGTGYQACEVPTHLELDRALTRVCTALRALA